MIKKYKYTFYIQIKQLIISHSISIKYLTNLLDDWKRIKRKKSLVTKIKRN